MLRVLVIGRNPDRAQGLAAQLGLFGHESAPSASDPALVLRSVEEFRPDVVVTDGVPDVVLRQLVGMLRQASRAHLIVLPEHYSDDDLVYYLDQGVADYLPKPVTAKSLSARLRAHYDARAPENPSIVKFGELELDAANHAVRRDGALVPLTLTEYRLFGVLWKNRGRACNHRTLLRKVGGAEFVGCEQYLRIYVGYLRKKLEEDPRKPRLILTVWGVGYRLSDHVSGSRVSMTSQRPQAEPHGMSSAF